ncbi:MAG: hypothetical protein ACUVTR_02105 [Dehalococcoidia bacterium]
MLVLNLTQHNATPEQIAQGVIEPPRALKGEIQAYLTFTSLHEFTREHLVEYLTRRANGLVDLAKRWLEQLPPQDTPACMIGGAPYFMPILQRRLKEEGFRVLFSFSDRVAEEKQNPDGSVVKTQVFKHLGFIEVD